MISSIRSLSLATVSLAACMTHVAMAAEAPETVQAVWQPQEVSFQYFGATTAYNCDALSDKIERILEKVGAREGLRVSAGGCQGSRPERSISVRVSMLAPVAVGEQDQQSQLSAEKQQALIKRVSGKTPVDMAPFAATWETVDLSKDRSLNIQAGDCELIEQLRNGLFAKMRIKILSDQTTCVPHQSSKVLPKLTVSALVPLKKPDAIATPKTG